MEIAKQRELWNCRFNDIGNINLIYKDLELLLKEVSKVEERLNIVLDLQNLNFVNSEIISKFVLVKNYLSIYEGKLKLENVNPSLQAPFDIVILDRIIDIDYLGTEK